MSEYSRRIVGAVVTVVLITAFVAIELNVLFPTNSTSPTITSSGQQFSSGISSNGLRLTVILNSTSIQSKGAISAQVKILNTLNRSVSFSGVTPNKDIFYNWSPFSYYCLQNPSDFLVGAAVFQGHYTAENLSTVTPLRLAAPAPGAPGCGEVGVHFPSTVTFLPNGDRVTSPEDSALVKAEANVTTGYCIGFGAPVTGGCFWVSSSSLVGYWNYTAALTVGNPKEWNFTSPAFAYFPPGEYTIVAADDWNQYVYATFIVKQ